MVKSKTIRVSNSKGKPYHWTIIMGDNGVGKTTLLKSFVAIAPSPKTIYADAQKLRLYPGIRDWRDDWDLRRHEGQKPSGIYAKTIGGYTFNKLLPKSYLDLDVLKGHKIYNDIKESEESYGKLGDFLCFAYGASRKMGRASLSGERYSTASISLFDDEAPLINVEEFFMQADYETKTTKSRSSLIQRSKVRNYCSISCRKLTI